MTEMGDRDRGRGGERGRRRRPRGGPPGRKMGGDRDYDAPPPQQASSRPTIILAKHSDNEQQQQVTSRSSTSTSPAPQSRLPEKPVMVLKNREESSRTLTPSVSLPSIPASTAQGDTPPQQTYIQRHVIEGAKLTVPQEMLRCIKLIDEHQHWSEAASDMLLDQTDFLVVGVIGLQGSGKSTILSLLAGNTEVDSYRNYVFPPQSREMREECGHMTSGIDIYVTPQRIILLDTQPVLSASVLDHMIHNEKKIPPEYSTAENYAEIQCLQQMTFLLTVCNVVIVVQDWFTDMSLLHFLQTAEMLKPSTPPSSHDSSGSQDDQPDYFPHIVFLQNKATREDFSIENFKAMQQTLTTVYNNSKLKMKGNVNMATARQNFGLNPSFVKSDLNLFLLPHMDSKKQPDNSDVVLTILPEYRGYPSFQTLINSFRSQIYSLPREPHTHTTLSEKNWFHYAARMWDSIKKSQLIAEYNRLLP